MTQAADENTTRAMTPSVGRPLWAVAAVDVLRETAGRFRAVTTYGELSSEVLLRTDTSTKVPMRRWIGPVLGLVAAHCAEQEEILLTALCVEKDGTVGDGYAEGGAAESVPYSPGRVRVAIAAARAQCRGYGRRDCQERSRRGQGWRG